MLRNDTVCRGKVQTYTYNQVHVTLHFDHWRKLAFYKIECQKYDAPTLSTFMMYYIPREYVKSFNLNLLLWVGQEWIFIPSTKVSRKLL